jgi:hypothetical protein
MIDVSVISVTTKPNTKTKMILLLLVRSDKKRTILEYLMSNRFCYCAIIFIIIDNQLQIFYSPRVVEKRTW